MAKNPKKEFYGKELILDLSDCDFKVINSKKKLEEFIVKICQLIKMERYNKPIISFFGLNKPKTAGYSLVQLIETSSITGHFSNLWRSAYINIFSCKDFDTEKAASFTQRFFGAKKLKKRIIFRK